MEQEEAGYLKRKTFQDCHYVLSDTIDDTEDDVGDFDELPQIDDEKNGTHVVGRKFKEMNTVRHPVTGVLATLWEVEVSYDSRYPGGDGEGGGTGNTEDPTDMRPKRRRYVEQEKEALTRDASTGLPVVTQAGEPIQAEKHQAIYVVEIERFEPFPLDGQKYLDYVNHTNSGPFMGAPRGCAWLAEMEDEEVIVNGNVYAKVIYRLKFKIRQYDDPQTSDVDSTPQEDGWMVEVLHQGFMYRPEAGDDPQMYIDPKTKQPARVNLKVDTSDPNGPLFAGGTLLEENADAQFLKFHEFPYTDFGPLNLEF
jgi:hypothetical protein